MAQLAQLTRGYDSGGRAQLVAGYLPASVGTPTFSSPADRGTLDIANCSYADNVFTFRSRWDNSENSLGATFVYAQIGGVNGLTPSFQVVRSNYGMTVSASAKFMYSYDTVTWLPFTNRGSTSTYYTFSHDSAFIADVVYVAAWAAWPTGRTRQWIQSIEGSGYVSDTTSSSGYVFDTRDATVNEQGTAISSTDLYAFKVAGPGSNAPDGTPKRNMVLFAGMHASEDVGNYALKGAVEFLISEDPQAQTVRAWFDTFVYPLVASAGRKGGGKRGDFQSGYMTSDINRSWNGSTFQTVVKHKAAVLADTGGAAEVVFDFHGAVTRSTPYSAYLSSTDYATWATAIQSYEPGLAQLVMTEVGYSVEWAEATLNTTLSIIPEYIYGYEPTTQAGAEAYGANHMRAIALLANQEYFGASLDVYGSLAAVEIGEDSCACEGFGSFTFVGGVSATEDAAPDTCVIVGQAISYIAPPEIHWRDSLLTTQISAPSIISKKAYVGDVGSSIVLDTGQDISLALSATIEVRKPNGTFVSWVAIPNGTNSVRYDTVADSLDMPGPWKMQAKITLPTGTIRGETITLVVYPAFG